MTTKTALKATIADDLIRSDLTTQIGEAIDTAIKFYQNHRFYFNEVRSVTFATVASQSTYASSDSTNIPLFVHLDSVYLVDSSSRVWELSRTDPIDMEFLLDSSASEGRPYEYAYFESSFRLYPIPDGIYTVRPMGVIKKAVPATDGEADNVWMTEAYELIRCRAKAILAEHTLVDPDLMIRMVGPDGDSGATGRALSSLMAETAKKVSLGRIVPTTF